MSKSPSSLLVAALPRLPLVVRTLTSGPKIPRATDSRPPKFETIFVASAVAGGRLGAEILAERHEANVIEIFTNGRGGVRLSIGQRLPWGPPCWHESYQLWRANHAERCVLVPCNPHAPTWFMIEDEYIDAFHHGLP